MTWSRLHSSLPPLNKTTTTKTTVTQWRNSCVPCSMHLYSLSVKGQRKCQTCPSNFINIHNAIIMKTWWNCVQNKSHSKSDPSLIHCVVSFVRSFFLSFFSFLCLFACYCLPHAGSAFSLQLTLFAFPTTWLLRESCVLFILKVLGKY